MKLLKLPVFYLFCCFTLSTAEDALLERIIRDVTGRYHPELHGEHAHAHRHDLDHGHNHASGVVQTVQVNSSPGFDDTELVQRLVPVNGYYFPPPPPPTTPVELNGYANCGCVPKGRCAPEVVAIMPKLLSELKNDVVCGIQHYDMCCWDDPWPGYVDIFKPQAVCVPEEHCVRRYGASPTDVRDYGTIGPCFGLGSVRCLDDKPAPPSLPPPGPTTVIVPIYNPPPPPTPVYEPPPPPPPPTIPTTVPTQPPPPPPVYEPPPPPVYEPPPPPPPTTPPTTIPTTVPTQPPIYEPPPPPVYEPPPPPPVVYEVPTTPPPTPPTTYEVPVTYEVPTTYEPPATYEPPQTYEPPVTIPVTYEPPQTYEPPTTTTYEPPLTYEPPVPSTSYGAPDVDDHIVGVQNPLRYGYRRYPGFYGGYRYGVPQYGAYGGYPGYGFRKSFHFSKGFYG